MVRVDRVAHTNTTPQQPNLPTLTHHTNKQEVARKKTEEKALLAEWGREKEELEGTKNAQKELEAARRCVSDNIVSHINTPTHSRPATPTGAHNPSDPTPSPPHTNPTNLSP